MAEFKHPTNPDWMMFDGVDKESPYYKEPPKGEELLIVHDGVLLKSIWFEGAECWCNKPVVPPSVKKRRTIRLVARMHDEGNPNGLARYLQHRGH